MRRKKSVFLPLNLLWRAVFAFSCYNQFTRRLKIIIIRWWSPSSWSGTKWNSFRSIAFPSSEHQGGIFEGRKSDFARNNKWVDNFGQLKKMKKDGQEEGEEDAAGSWYNRDNHRMTSLIFLSEGNQGMNKFQDGNYFTQRRRRKFVEEFVLKIHKNHLQAQLQNQLQNQQ